MRQVPDGQGAGIMRGAGQGLHVMKAAVAVIHMGQHQNRHIFIQRRGDVAGVVDMDKAVPVAALLYHPFGDVIVSGKVARFGHDLGAVRPQGHCCRQDLEQVHRGAVGGNHTVRRGADKRRDARPDPARQVDPSGRIPASNQPRAPLALQSRGDAASDALRQDAKRIAVEIDHIIRNIEPGAKWRQRVRRVAGDGGGEAEIGIGGL